MDNGLISQTETAAEGAGPPAVKDAEDQLGGRTPTVRAEPTPPQAVEAAYRRAMQADAAQITALMTQARALRSSGDHEGALPILRAASFCRPKSVAILADLAISLWHLRLVTEAEAALRGVLVLDTRHAVCLAVLGRVLSHRQDHEAALPLFRRALEQRPGDPWLPEEIARCLMQLNRWEDAAAIWQQLSSAAPDNARVLLAYAHVRRCQGDNAAALDLLHAAIALQPSAQAYCSIGLVFRGMDRRDDAEAAFLTAVELEPACAPALLQLGLLARGRVDDAAALAWFRQAASAAPDDPGMMFEVAVSLADLHRQDESDAVLAIMDSTPLDPALAGRKHDYLLLRRLDYCCRSQKLDAALECLREFGPIQDLPSRAVSLAAGLLAARGDWEEVLSLFTERIVPGVGANLVPATETLIEALARAARARSQQAEMLALLPGWADADNAAVANLRDQLTEELLLLHRIWPELQPPLQTQAASLRVDRGVRMKTALAGTVRPVAGTLFWCSDLNYLPGTLVAVASALRHNRAALCRCRFCVFLSEDAMPVARPMIGRLADAYGLTIEIVSAATLGFASTGFRQDWGNFTPGHRLSDAAYYRILAALWLATQDRPGPAVYLDSDTCAGPGLAALLRFDLAGRPIAARLEDPLSPSIRRAANKLGMAPETYFNSGVLILDLAHASCVHALRHALDVAVTLPEQLSFLDQCALNLAFMGLVTPMPDSFNVYVRHKDDVADLSENDTVTHYLGRPKPWDPAYCAEVGNRWLEEFYALGDVLLPGEMRTLLAMNFRAATGVPAGFAD